MRLYRIELEDKGETVTFTPRIPKYTMSGEDEDTERICAAPSIRGCIDSIILPICINDKNIVDYYDILNIQKQEYPLWIYAADVPCKDIVQPKDYDVPDAFFTGELWITAPCEFTKMGKYLLGVLNDTDYGEYTTKYYLRQEGYEKPIEKRTDRVFLYEKTSFAFLRQHVYKKDKMVKEIENIKNGVNTDPAIFLGKE